MTVQAAAFELPEERSVSKGRALAIGGVGVLVLGLAFAFGYRRFVMRDD